MKMVRFIQGGITLCPPAVPVGEHFAPSIGIERAFEDEIADDLIRTGYAEEVKEGAPVAPSAPSPEPVATQAADPAPESNEAPAEVPADPAPAAESASEASTDSAPGPAETQALGPAPENQAVTKVRKLKAQQEG